MEVLLLKKMGKKIRAYFSIAIKKQEIHVPINIESGTLFIRPLDGCDVYSDINVKTDSRINFDTKTALKSGAVLRIGTVE